jgi:hypothetical protein
MHYSIELRGERCTQRARLLTSTRHYLPWGLQVEPTFLRKLSFRFLAPAASSNFAPCTGAYGIACVRPSKVLRCDSSSRPGEDVHQAFRAISVRFQRLTADSKSPPPAADAFAERSQTAEDGIGLVAVLL